jgi:membrane protease YdiL (CAAX protease family)
VPGSPAPDGNRAKRSEEQEDGKQDENQQHSFHVAVQPTVATTGQNPEIADLMAPPYPWPRVVALSAGAGLFGLATHLVAEALGWDFPSFGATAASIAWKLAMLLILVRGFARWEGRRPTASDLGWQGDRNDASRWPVAIAGLLGCGVLAVIIGQFLPSAGSGESYGEVQKAGVALAVAELLVRYPLTVFAEESFFRGWLQPRIPRWGPVASGVLFAGFHLQQASTIPSLVPLGIGLGIIRWATGNVRVTAVIHYLSNAVFFVTTYL